MHPHPQLCNCMFWPKCPPPSSHSSVDVFLHLQLFFQTIFTHRPILPLDGKSERSLGHEVVVRSSPKEFCNRGGGEGGAAPMYIGLRLGEFGAASGCLGTWPQGERALGAKRGGSSWHLLWSRTMESVQIKLGLFKGQKCRKWQTVVSSTDPGGVLGKTPAPIPVTLAGLSNAPEAVGLDMCLGDVFECVKLLQRPP